MALGSPGTSRLAYFPQQKSDNNHKSLQKTANKVILRTVHNDDGPKHIRHHICLKWGIIFDTEVPQSVEDALPHTLVALGALGPSCASKIIKTWLNGWVTSYRMHEEHLHQCLFGCDDRDSLDHYTSCHFVHSLQSFLVPGCPRDKLARWGVCAYDASIFKLVCCTFSGYHAVKAEVRNMQTNRKIEVVKWDHIGAASLQRQYLVTFANAFLAEAGELGIATRAFSVAKFLYYLVCDQGSPPLPAIASGNSSGSGGLAGVGVASRASSSAASSSAGIRPQFNLR